MSWNAHIAYVTAKMSKGIGMINRIKKLLSGHHQLLKTLYNTMIYPHLLYCNIVWGGANVTALNKLLILQKRAVRMIANAYYLAPSSNLFSRLHILKIHEIHTLSISLFMFNAKHRKLPNHLLNFVEVVSASRHNTRMANEFVFPFARTTIRQRSLSFCGPRIWHSLPYDIRHCPTWSTFNNSILVFLISNY